MGGGGLLLLAAAAAAAGEARVVEGGRHRRFYPPSEEQAEVVVPTFRMDEAPVTIGEFRAFLEANPGWQRGRVPALFADATYLASWAGPADPGGLAPDLPVTEVSWYAARAYCRARGGDLPTVDQWEYAADATATERAGARRDPGLRTAILDWYARSATSPMRPIRQGPPNAFGLYDLHGLIWEWTLDFNSLLIAADAREAGDQENLRFCGAGSLSASDVEDYPSFMRFAMRSSVQAKDTTRTLGFRCAHP